MEQCGGPKVTKFVSLKLKAVDVEFDYAEDDSSTKPVSFKKVYVRSKRNKQNPFTACCSHEAASLGGDLDLEEFGPIGDFTFNLESEDSKQEGTFEDEENKQIVPYYEDLSNELRALFSDQAESQEVNSQNLQGISTNLATSSSPKISEPINIIYLNMQDKEVIIGGKRLE